MASEQSTYDTDLPINESMCTQRRQAPDSGDAGPHVAQRVGKDGGDLRGESTETRAPRNGYNCIAPDVKLGQSVMLAKFINLYGCEVGDETKIGAFVEIQKNAKVGRRCKVSSHTFICEGVTIEDHVFIGHGVTFINDSFPRATTPEGELQTEQDWTVEATLVRRGASIGSGATILSNVAIGENAVIGAGSVVTRDVPAHAVVAGNPARVLRYVTTSLEGTE